MALVFWVRVCLVLQMCLSGVVPGSSAADRSYYDTLDVEPTATDTQIKKNFRKLAMKYHPDKNKSAHAETKFREIAEAYHVLSNPKKRTLYDRVGHEAFLNNEASVDPKEEYSDDFDFRFHDVDGNPFAEEPYFHWSFHQTAGDAGAGFQYNSIEDPFFGIYFGDDEDDNLH